MSSDTRSHRPTGAFTVAPVEDEPLAIDVRITRNPGDVDPTTSELAGAVERANSILRQVAEVSIPGIRGTCASLNLRLIGLAQAGLVGAHARPSLARSALRTLELEAANRLAGELRRTQWRSLAYWTLGGVAALLALQWVSDFYLVQPNEPTVFRQFPMLAVGAVLGTWISFGVRTESVSFADLPQLVSKFTDPAIRLSFSVAIAFVVTAFLLSEVLELNLASDEPVGETVKTHWAMAMSLGALCGLSERVLPARLASAAERMLRFGDDPLGPVVPPSAPSAGSQGAQQPADPNAPSTPPASPAAQGRDVEEEQPTAGSGTSERNPR